MMSPSVLLYVGSGIVIVWGIAHILPTRSVVKGFGALSEDNRRIITMEWVAEGLALTFLGVLVLLVTLHVGPGDPTAVLVIRACAAMLVILAAWTFAVGGKTSVVPIRVCPIVLTAAAVLCFLGTVI